jgi:hypothetical protein
MMRATYCALAACALAAVCDALVAPSAFAATRAPRRRPVAAVAPAELWDGYLAALEATPLPVKMATATVIIGGGDAAAQAIEGARTNKAFDAARLARWAFFGFVLQAPWNHAFQNALEAALPSTAEPFTATTFLKVGIDQGLQAPAFTALIFVFFAVIEGRGVGAGVAQVREDLAPTLVKNWAVFLPATVVNLAYVPLELRVLFINVVFFFWVIFLSLLINKGDAPPPPPGDYAMDAATDADLDAGLADGSLDMGAWDPADFTDVDALKALNADLKDAIAAGDAEKQRGLAMRIEMLEEVKMKPGMFDMSSAVDDADLDTRGLG